MTIHDKYVNKYYKKGDIVITKYILGIVILNLHFTLTKIKRIIQYYLNLNKYKNNCIIVVDKYGNEKKYKNCLHMKGFYVHFKGNNNVVKIFQPAKLKSLGINIHSDNNTVILEKSVDIYKSKINIFDGEHNTIKIGADTTINGLLIQTYEDNSVVTIGKNCMISCGVEMWCTDSHTITDLNNRVINIGMSIELEDHVWVGKDVKIGKNTRIPKDSIVGWGAVVTKKFDERNVVLAGNPAKIVKHNIMWARPRVRDFLKMCGN